MARSFKLKLPDSRVYRGWGFVAICAVVLAILVFLDRGGLQSAQSGATPTSGGCRVEVTGTEVNVRTAPTTASPVVAVLRRGELRPATQTVRDGFRQLDEDQWVAEQFVTPVSGTTC